MPKWRYGDALGSGGYGRVFDATQIDEDGTKRPGYALKFLLDEHLGDAEAVARFEREVRLSRDQLNHPNVMRVVASNLSASPPWFVMPKANSGLREELANGEWNDEDWVVLVFRQILAGVAHAHAEGILHRDLKPENVLFVNGVPQIADFGLGKRLGSGSATLTDSHVGMGTLAYMAPEQFTNTKDVDARADVYALGKMLCEMLTGDEPKPFRHDLMGVPARFRYFVSKCCQDEPTDRYADAGEALTEFGKLVGEVEIVQPPKDEAIALVNAWEGTPPGEDLEATRGLDEHLRRHQGDGELYRAVVASLPRAMVEQYIEELPNGFAEMLRAYDGHVDGGLSFDYCDVLANFYAFVWSRNADPDVRRMMLARLVDVGPSHNRWHVGGVVRNILASIQDPGTAQLAADVLRADPSHALWFDGYLENQPVPRQVADAMKELRDPPPAPTTSEWDVPF